MKPFHFLQCAGPAAAMLLLLGGAAPAQASGVTLAFDRNAGCYRVEFDLTAISHREAGAVAIFGPGTKIPESARELIEILNTRAA